MSFSVGLVTSVVSGLYTSLWGAFKDCPYEGFKPWTFPRSVLFNVAIYLAGFSVPAWRVALQELGVIQLFFLIMGVERFLAELYKGFFRTEDQRKYHVPSRITFFGRHVASDALRYAAGAVLVALVVAVFSIQSRITHYPGFLLTAYGAGLVVAMGGAYKDGPFEGFKILKFQRSAAVLAVFSPMFYFLNNPAGPVPLGFLVFMNGGLERFAVEYYKTYIQRNMSGKFRPDLQRIQRLLDTREKYHYLALVIIAGLVVLYVRELSTL